MPDGSMHPENASITTPVENDAPEPSRLGSRIGRYLVLGHLGRGGMGDVYTGRDTELGRLVALKFLAPAALGVESSVRRFIREAKSASAINHPNIVTIHEVIQVESTLAIVMEFVDGTALRKLCAVPLPIDQVVAFAEQIAQALTAAHAAGIIHRDVKPENIMVRPDGYIKLLDFGLAHQLSFGQPGTGSGTLNGTWRYMSPEQARGEQLAAQSDMFSFGLVLYEMCTGSHPFAADSPLETLHAIGARPAERPARLNPFVPEKLELLLLAMLAKNAAERPSAAEVARELRQFHRRNSSDVFTTAVTPIPLDSTATARNRFTLKTLKWTAPAALALALGLAIPMVRWNTAAKAGSAGLSPIASLAVLPLENAARESSPDYLIDGMTDRIITKLARTTSLRVLSHSALMRYKSGAQPVSEIARALRADAIVQGSVAREGDHVRITAKLIDARADRHLWEHSYECNLKDSEAIEDQVVRDISREVAATLPSRDPTQTNRGPVPNPLAFEDYLKGRFQRSKQSSASLDLAAAYFEKAIARDENYAAAYAGLADTYTMMGELTTLAPEEAHRRAKIAALKALQIDGNLAEAHASLGFSKAAYDRDWTGAEQEFKRALELNPSYGAAHHRYSTCLSLAGRHAEALVEIRRAQELDPLDQAIAVDLGWCFYLARRYDLAAAQLKSAIAMSPQQPFPHYRLGLALVQAGQPLQALVEFRRSANLSKGGAQYLAGMGFGYSIAGRKSEARQTLATLLRMRAEHRHVLASGVAIVYAGMGDKDQSLFWLEKAYEERDDNVYALNVDPLFDSIRPDSRCRNLLGRLGFTP